MWVNFVADAGNGGKHVRTYFKSHEPGTFMGIDDWGSAASAHSRATLGSAFLLLPSVIVVFPLPRRAAVAGDG
ncbi:MAG TPA: hypothetical protein VLC73_10725 [Burkholderiales bacterium]|nr:hypothetical protein [Burkholderiales bacterium]